MSDPLTIRLATAGDAPAVGQLVQDAVQWLSASGHDQWQGPGFGRLDRIEAAIHARELWVVHADATLAATFTLNGFADPEFWTPADDPELALYLHRIVVRRSHSGLGLGAAMLDWAGALTVAAGRPLLRLDAWATNADLHRYYLAHGFHLVRIVTLPHRGSGALFERPSEYRTGRGPALQQVTRPISA